MEDENNQIIDPKLISIDDLLENNYIIPIYQREYSWSKDNIYKLLNSINSGNYIYLGNIIIEKKDETTYKIIDGQQRITTLLLILYYLDFISYDDINKKIVIESENESDKLKKLSEGKEKVIQKIEEEFSKETKEKDKRKKENEWQIKNIYLLNLYYIFQFFKDVGNKEKFLKNIKDKIKFVRIIIKTSSKEENKFNISKIFDEINTTGKPLETKDKFKVRLYNMNNEYGKRIEEIYAEINKKENELIDTDSKKKEELFVNYKNKGITGNINNFIEVDSERYDVEYFLRLYQFFLIVKKRNNIKTYTRELLEMRYETFFDSLFEILNENNFFDIQENEVEDYKEIEDEEDEEDEGNNREDKRLIYENLLENRKKFRTFIENGEKIDEIIQIKDINKLYDVLKRFKEYVMDEKNWIDNENTYFTYKLFKKYNRYNWTYQYLPILYFYVFENKKDFNIYFNSFIESISKLCALYTICYSRIKKECKEKLIEITESLIDKTNTVLSSNSIIEDYTNEIIKDIDDTIKSKKEELKDVLSSNDITENDGRKKVICLILAKDAEENENNKKNYYNRIDQLFSIKIDIEHIYAFNRAGEENGLKKEEINEIGNLMILERPFNESIKDDSIDKKIKKYKNSAFKVVIDLFNDLEENLVGKNHDKRFIETIGTRKKNNINKIMEFFGLDYNENIEKEE